MTIVIAREVPSENRYTYSHWRAYTKERDFWLVLLRLQLRPRFQAPDHPVRAKLVSLRGRELDFGNLVGGAKPIPDCLIRLGYLRDDSPRWFTCEYSQRVVPKALRCTRIHLEPA